MVWMFSGLAEGCSPNLGFMSDYVCVGLFLWPWLLVRQEAFALFWGVGLISGFQVACLACGEEDFGERCDWRCGDKMGRGCWVYVGKA